MGLKKWLSLDFSSSGHSAATANTATRHHHERVKSTSSNSGSGSLSTRRHSSLPPPRVPAPSSSSAYRSSSVDQRDVPGGAMRNSTDSDAVGRGTAFATALQMSPRRHAELLGEIGVGLHSPNDVAAAAYQAEMTMEDLESSPTYQEADAFPNHSPPHHKEEPKNDAVGERRRSQDRSSLRESRRFSWHNVLGDSSRSDAGTRVSVIASDQGAKEAAAKDDGTKHDPDVTVRPQDNEMGVVMQGWLEKCGQQFKTWNWRFFVLRDDGVLSYYTDESKKKLKGSINVGFGSKADISVQSNMIEKKFVFMIASPQRNTMISAPSQHMMTKWIGKLHGAGATPSEPWDPLKKTVKFFVRDSECPHEWKRYDDPTSYIHMEGCLLKRGHVNKNWKNRFFRIEKGELRYYTENQEVLKGSVPLKGTIVSPGMAQCSDGRKYYFVLTSRDGKFEMHLNAYNESSMHKWIEAIQEAQTALGRTVGAKETVSGLALVVKRAEEIPLAKISVLYNQPHDIAVELERRTEALVVTKAPKDDVPVGSQLIAVDGRSILREEYSESRDLLRSSSFPLTLEFLLPPYKKGLLIKKSRSGFENWKKRVLVVTNGEVHYYKQVVNGKSTTLKHRKSFSLYGCYLNLVQFPNRPLCIVVARSPSDKLVLQTRSEEERIEWASVIYCSIRLVSQGITSGHIANLNLEKAQEAATGDAALTPDLRSLRESVRSRDLN
ncbi:Pleckstrin-like domain-containing protein [Globisporangium polare]